MRTFLLATITLSCLSLFSHDTTFYNFDGFKVGTRKDCDHFEVLHRSTPDTLKGILREYYQSGQIKSEEEVFYRFRISTGGTTREWYDNGQLRRTYSFKGDNLHGVVLSFYQDGKSKRKDVYNDGVLVEGHSLSPDSTEVPQSEFIRQAGFRGGIGELIKYLGNELKYPKNAVKQNIAGTVYVQFTITREGRVQNAMVMEGVSPALDNEALRVVKKMPTWIPKMIEGEVVLSTFLLPVTFKLTSG